MMYSVFVSCSAGCGASITAVLTALNSGNGSVVITSHSKHVEYNPENYIPELKNIEVMHGIDIFEHDFGDKHVIIDGAQVFDPDFLTMISAKKDYYI